MKSQRGFSLLEIMASLSLLSTLILLSLPAIRSVISNEVRTRLSETNSGRLESVETFVRQNIFQARALKAFDGFKTTNDVLAFEIPDVRFFFRVFDYTAATGKFRTCLNSALVSEFSPLQSSYDRYIAFSKEGYFTLSGSLKRATKNTCTVGTEYAGNLAELSGGMNWISDTRISTADLAKQTELLIPLQDDLKLWTDSSQTLRRSFSGSVAGQPMGYGFGDLKVYPQTDGSTELRLSAPKPRNETQSLFVPRRTITQGKILNELF